MGIADVVDLKTSNAIYVIIPDYADGPGILTVKDTVGDTVPSVYITGPIFDSITGKKAVKTDKPLEAEKLKIKRPVIPTVKENIKLPQEVKPQEEIPAMTVKAAVNSSLAVKPAVKRPIIKPILLNKKNT